MIIKVPVNNSNIISEEYCLDCKLEVKLNYCKNGHIYLNLDSLMYFVDINKDNNLCLELIEDINILPLNESDELKFRKIKYSGSDTTLKGKAIENILSEESDNNIMKEFNKPEIHDYNDELYEEDEFKFKRKVNYFPEEKYYYFDETNNEDNLSDDSNEEINTKFTFSIFGIKNPITLFDRKIDSPSIYDTFIFDQTLGNNYVVFTSESNIKSYYRITISDNQFTLNIVGTSIKKYYLKYIDDKLMFV
jgi:hypothetical protein